MSIGHKASRTRITTRRDERGPATKGGKGMLPCGRRRETEMGSKGSLPVQKTQKEQILWWEISDRPT